MDEKENLLSSFEVFYVSQEPSQSPISAQVQLFAKIFENNVELEKSPAVMSHRFGKRVVITTTEEPFSSLSDDDFIELVDYDPIKQVLLVLGKKKPLESSPLHWMIHHARTETQVVLELCDPTFVQKISQRKKVNNIIKKQGAIIEQAKALLAGFRESNTVVFDDKTVFLIGMNIKEITHTLQQVLGNIT